MMKNEMDYQFIRLEIKDNIATLALTEPKALTLSAWHLRPKLQNPSGN